MLACSEMGQPIRGRDAGGQNVFQGLGMAARMCHARRKLKHM